MSGPTIPSTPVSTIIISSPDCPSDTARCHGRIDLAEAVVSGLAPLATIEKALAEAKKTGIYSIIDMLNVTDPVALIRELKVKPDIVELHRGIDCEETGTCHVWGNIEGMREAAGGKLLVATAGGIRVENIRDAIAAGSQILVVGRAITASKDVRHAAEEFLEQLGREEIDQFRIMTDF